MDPVKAELNQDRRQFIKKVLKGTIGGSLLLVIPAGADVLKIPEQIAGIRDKEWDLSKQNFAFIVDITVCIGCGSCCVADKREYNVPDGNYRTWVERYLKDFDDEVYVDSPNGGLDGYQEPRKDLDKPIRDTFFVPKLCNMCKDPSGLSLLGSLSQSNHAYGRQVHLVLSSRAQRVTAGLCQCVSHRGTQIRRLERHRVRGLQNHARTRSPDGFEERYG